MKVRVAFISLFIVLPSPAFAADRPSPDATANAPTVSVSASVVTAVERTTSRPAPLVPLYVLSAGLHAYDGYSTLRSLQTGVGVEANPLMQQIAGNPAALVGAKVLMAATTVASAESLWRRGHPRQAVVLMLVSNGIMAAVCAHNGAIQHGR